MNKKGLSGFTHNPFQKFEKIRKFLKLLTAYKFEVMINKCYNSLVFCFDAFFEVKIDGAG